MTSAKTIARSLTQCPYCDHVSPDDSKFCNECGAALHLKPCPHCGSLNDVTLASNCSRCGGNLRENTVIEFPGASEGPINNNPSGAPAEDPGNEEPLLPTPRGPRVAAALVVTAAAATALYVYLARDGEAPQRAAASTPPTVQAPQAARPPAVSPAPVQVQPAPAPAEAPVAQAQAAAKPAPPARPSRSSASADRPPPASRAAPGTDIAPKPVPIGPCTTAVAALGLCTSSDPDNHNTTARRP